MTAGALEASRRERDRLDKNYRVAKDKQFADLCAGSEYGVRLRKLVATLGHFGIGDSDRFLKYFDDECRKWLRASATGIHDAALEAISNRSMAIRMKAGLFPLDDPLPGQPDNVFLTCRKMLNR